MQVWAPEVLADMVQVSLTKYFIGAVRIWKPGKQLGEMVEKGNWKGVRIQQSLAGSLQAGIWSRISSRNSDKLDYSHWRKYKSAVALSHSSLASLALTFPCVL